MYKTHSADVSKATIAISWLLLCVTATLAAAFMADTLSAYLNQNSNHGPSLALTLVYALCGGALIFSSSAHLLARLGYHMRMRSGAQTLVSLPTDVSVGIIVPAFREEPDVIHRTLLSAALQTHPRKWIRLLLDDPPDPTSPASLALLEAGRSAPDRVDAFLAQFVDLAREARRSVHTPAALAALHGDCARLLRAAAKAWPDDDHENRLFSSLVLKARADAHLERLRITQTASLSRDEALEEIGRVAASYAPSIGVFERKRYQNLSHAPNKAMNLNSYIGLLGQQYRVLSQPDGLYLAAASSGEMDVPSAKYVVTLDADSILVPAYLEILGGIMESPGGERLAVVQTPYAATPDAPGRLERVAGATTDVQRLLHQGYTRFGGTFWVGANAVLRLTALQDIRQSFEERGHRLFRYIQDRTVIEDTESTIDLVRRGWTLWNHPEALAYSATPPDFGSLVIQRRRWACGGLLILPKAVRTIFKRGSGFQFAQAVIRLHYLGSLAWVPAALITLVLVPFDRALDTWYLPLAALPYYIAYVWDLRTCGRSSLDIVRVYALNLLLIPVHLSGAVASLLQAVTGRSVPFQRTPKVEGRTSAPRWMLMVIWLAPLLLALGSLNDLLTGENVRGVLSLTNACLFAGAAFYFIGARATLEDLAPRRMSRRGSPHIRSGGPV